MSIDSIFIEFVHNLCVQFGSFLTPIMRVISFCGDKGWLFVVIAFFMMFRKKTRWVGATATLAILIGFIIGSVFMKPFFMRMRPYTASNLFQDYWVLAGSFTDSGYSMPSGHTIAVTAFFLSLYITSAKQNRKLIKNVGIVAVILMIISRCYLMHHYLTDCIVGVIVAFVTSYLAKFIVRLIFNFCKKYSDIGIFRFILNFDVIHNIKKDD